MKVTHVKEYIWLEQEHFFEFCREHGITYETGKSIAKSRVHKWLVENGYPFEIHPDKPARGE